MKRIEAEKAIREILEQIDDDQLPKPTIEVTDRGTVAWFGGMGHALGSATQGGIRRPANYRDGAIYDALKGEATYRLDVKHLAAEVADHA